MRKTIAHFGEAEISSQLGTRSFVDVTLDKEDDDTLIAASDHTKGTAVIDKGDKMTYIHKRRGYWEVMLRSQNPEIPDEALLDWATYQAEKDWHKDRVYADPIQIEQAPVHVHGTDARVNGVRLRINPAGPMVTTIDLSTAELRELVTKGAEYLRTRGELPEGCEHPTV
jgi:hypothetical protein